MLTRFPEPDVVRDEQADARHPNRPHERVELVSLDFDPALERREQVFGVGRRGGAPAHRVEESVEPLRIIERVRLWQRRPLEHARARLDFPYDLQRFIRLGVVLDGSEGDEMFRLGRRLKRIAAKLVRFDLGDDPPTLANVHELALLRK
jgi:hypothetical protein